MTVKNALALLWGAAVLVGLYYAKSDDNVFYQFILWLCLIPTINTLCEDKKKETDTKSNNKDKSNQNH